MYEANDSHGLYFIDGNVVIEKMSDLHFVCMFVTAPRLNSKTYCDKLQYGLS